MKLRVTWALLVAAAIGASGPAYARAMAVPPALQAAIIKKVLSYDTTVALDPAASPRLVIVRDGIAESDLQALQTGFAANDIEIDVADASTLAEHLANAVAIYISDERIARNVANAAQAAHVLSFTGVSSLVDKGFVSVGLEENNGRPKIVVNLTRLQKEGHSLAAGLLALARVVR